MITYSSRDRVAWITIDDVERRNPLSNQAMIELHTSIDRAGADPDVGVVVVTGAGDVSFSAGGDLAGGFVDSPLGDHEERGSLKGLFRSLRMNPKPIIARVNGLALGGGFGLAVACDITIMVDDGKMGTPEIGLGLWPMMISAVLVRSTPRKALLEMMMTGRMISADEAKVLGLVTTVVAREELDDAVASMVETLLAQSPAALALGKRAFYTVDDMDFDTALDHLHIGLTAAALTEDGAEGVAAFVEKRAPVWKGR